MSSSVASNPFVEIGLGIINGAKNIQGDVSNSMRVWRSAGNILSAVAPVATTRLRGVISVADLCIDAGQTAVALDDLTSKTNEKDVPVLKKLADVAFLGVGVGSIVQFLDHVNVITLPTEPASELFGRITIEVIGKAVTALLGVAFLILGINSTVKLVRSIQTLKAEESKAGVTDLQKKHLRATRNQNILDMFHAATQVAFFALAFFAAVSTIALITVGVAGAVVGIAAFLHSRNLETIEKDLKMANKQVIIH